jgi:hypothetical protein
MARTVLIDGRNMIDPAAARRAGFDYSGIGTGPVREVSVARRKPMLPHMVPTVEMTGSPRRPS